MSFSSHRIAALTLVCLVLPAVQAKAQQDSGGLSISGADSVSVRLGPDGTGVMVLPDGTTQTVDMKQPFSVPGGPASPGTVFKASGGGIMVGPNGVMQPLDINQIRQRSLDSLKAQLGSSDDEWAVLLPKLQKIQSLAGDAAASISGFGMMMVSSTGSGSPKSDVQLKLRELQQAVESGASDQEVKMKLAAARAARQAARDELARTRKELTDLLTQKQEAILYQRGILD